MIGFMSLALAAATADPLGEAAKALAAGREIQAGMMISAARVDGASGEPVDRLSADHALASGDPHAWSLKGIAADRRSDFDAADAAYDHAAALAPTQAAVANNRGWSLMLRGRWAEAADALQSALSLDPAVPHGAANLELARAALAADLPAKGPDETDDAFAARLNDAGVVAALQGNRPRAIAAFSRAIEARRSWFARAAHNLDLAEHSAP